MEMTQDLQCRPDGQVQGYTEDRSREGADADECGNPEGSPAILHVGRAA